MTPEGSELSLDPNTPPFQHRLPLGPSFTSPRSSDLVQAHGEAGPADPSCTLTCEDLRRCRGQVPEAPSSTMPVRAVTILGEDVSGNKLLSADVTAVKYHFMSCQGRFPLPLL